METEVKAANEEILYATPATPKKSNKSVWIILAIIAVLLICTIFCILLTVLVIIPSFKSSTKTYTEFPTNTPTISISKSTDINDIIGQKDINDFFPITFNKYNLRSIGVQNYMVGPVIEDYKKNNATSQDPIAQLREGYYALYGTESKTALEIIPEKTVRIIVYKFTDSEETQDAIDITNGLFQDMPEDFNTILINFDDEVEYIAAYKNISSNEVDSTSSGDARIFFKDDNFMIIISTARDFTLSEFQNLIKSYIDSFKIEGLEHVATSKILNRETYESLNLD